MIRFANFLSNKFLTIQDKSDRTEHEIDLEKQIIKAAKENDFNLANTLIRRHLKRLNGNLKMVSGSHTRPFILMLLESEMGRKLVTANPGLLEQCQFNEIFDYSEDTKGGSLLNYLITYSEVTDILLIQPKLLEGADLNHSPYNRWKHVNVKGCTEVQRKGFPALMMLAMMCPEKINQFLLANPKL